MSQNELQQLRGLLLKPEQQRLDELEAQAITPQQRLQEMKQALPTAIAQSADDGRLADALAHPIKHGLSNAIRDDARGLAEVLFPVMGPSIRRAIAEALRDFVSSINGTVAQAVSWQGLRWRMEALRTGRSYGEVVLSHTLSYRVEQALLIHRDSGLVISKAELSEVVANDSDAFSAMLGAIQDFVSDSLEGDSALSTLDMGDRTIWIVRGPHAHLACIISGLPQPGLREFLADVLDDAHNAFGALLKEFNGDPDSVKGVDRYTQRCLGNPVQPEQDAAPPRWPALLLLALLLLLLGWLIFCDRDATLDQQISRALNDHPGIAVQSISKQDGRWQVQLLRDPLAQAPSALLQAARLPVDDIQIHSRAYQSLDAAVVEKRVRRSLAMPDSVNSELQDDTLLLSGRAPWQWLDRLNKAQMLPAGVSAIDSTQVDAEYGLHAMRRDLPKGVQVEVVDNALQFSGEVELGWIRQLKGWLTNFASLPLAPQQQLKPREWRQLNGLVADIDGQSVYFSEMMQLAADEDGKVSRLEHTLQRVDELTQALGVTARLRITAWSDGLGSQARNHEIRTLRSAKVDRLLNPQGTLHMPVLRVAHPEYVQSEQADPALRRVDLALEIGPLPDIQP